MKKTKKRVGSLTRKVRNLLIPLTAILFIVFLGLKITGAAIGALEDYSFAGIIILFLIIIFLMRKKK